jgi:hypothetical protein
MDEGRFPAGTLLAERYRIIGQFGKGGMSEVYRANDLRLGQEEMARGGRALARFHNEVRTARQVSHPNVCRGYDIGEVDGRPFCNASATRLSSRSFKRPLCSICLYAHVEGRSPDAGAFPVTNPGATGATILIFCSFRTNAAFYVQVEGCGRYRSSRLVRTDHGTKITDRTYVPETNTAFHLLMRSGERFARRQN